MSSSEPNTPTTPPSSIEPRLIEREMRESYLNYSMSVILSRALPDVRDGLKPSQRRILVAMHDLNLTPGRKQIKCAKICGDTSGNYHPHGESVIYPTLVNMGQDWKARYMFVDKQGNFGSIEGDPPAAMRYTEARMTHAAMAMMEDLDKETVDFKPNYDERLMEPCVLPGKFPNLLVNGSSGIAVGMSSTMPPHNVREICGAIVATIDDPLIGVERLMEIVPGPDFPTGGIIMGRRGIMEAYASGRGRIVVRGCVRHEKSAGRDVIIIDEIPFQVSQSALIEKIVEASREDRIPDVSDVRNHSGRDARTRIQIILKKGADPAIVEKQLYEFTPLQTSYSIQNIALVNHQPRTLSLRQLIQCYIDHRCDVIRRRCEFELRHARQAAHKLEGLIYAVCDIDEVIRLIRTSRTREEAIERLMERAFRIPASYARIDIVPARLVSRAEELFAAGDGGVRLTRVQAEAIGALRLIQLVGLEIEKLAGELSALLAKIDELEAILATRQALSQQKQATAAGLLPKLSLFANAGGTSNLSSLGNFELGGGGCCGSTALPLTSTNGWDWSMGLTMTWLLFDAGNTAGQARALAKREAAAAQQYAATRNDIRLRLEQAFFNHEASLAKLSSARRGVAAALEAFRDVRLRYLTGLDSELNLSNTQDRLINSLVRRINATVNVNITYAKLLKELLPMPRDPNLPIQPQLQLQLSSSPATQP